MRSAKRQQIWRTEIRDIVRGACGGFLFGIPLLYTMEVWWIGSFIEPPRMLIAIAATFVVVFMLNRTSGFRNTRDTNLQDAAMDSVEAIALGLACAALILTLLREIAPSTPLDEALGKIIYEGVPFTLGVALARQLLRADDNGNGQETTESRGRQSGSSQTSSPAINDTLSDIGGTLIGSLFIAFNIAPTDEVAMLSSAVSPPWLIAIIVTSLLISYGIVFEANFSDQKKRKQQRGIFQRPLSETVMSYLVSLAAAAVMLWFFDQLSFDDPWSMWLSYTLILGLPATIGGAAGRLAV
ncbi:TIGR02587 family membrane protein [Oscillatoria sp. FACHB-1407]|uniref:TIGR02587 family membrane protein n=1 Tax=Oscillatoria sp. FACHB-1407 TaxID=2692847 RepID=UPI00168901C6|nr:TIGR02587 family membrane protein [Oscillatoria sp. FACHB-1407]MBD2462778.1 TIGR02587 family membrane protein [Oscillatoria sp. FACHB-1407]